MTGDARPAADGDSRLFSPAAARNAGPIRDALGPCLAGLSGTVLEIGSGSGEHILGWAEAFAHLDWQPSDPDADKRASIDAWARWAPRPNLRPALALDATGAWPEGPFAAVISLNVIHIAPWAVADAIMAEGGRRLVPGGVLALYGPFRLRGAHTGPGNVAFDARLRAEDPAWGIRDLETVADLAAAAGLSAPEVVEMPADNRLVAFRRPG